MAEHVSHELARAGFAVRPSRVVTLAGFLDGRVRPAPTEFQLHSALDGALARLRPSRFAEVADFPGFRERLARLIQRVPAGAVGGDLGRIIRDVERTLASRGCALRQRRIQDAVENPGALPPHIVFDGFFSFSPQELSLVVTLASRTCVTVTLPVTVMNGASARSELLARGFAEQRCDEIHRRGKIVRFAAPTLEREVEEIARRVIEEAQSGRAFKEIGVVARAREPYATALETAFARFGIPARFYFADALIAHPAIAFLAEVARAMLGGWRHEDLLRVARLRFSGLDDHFDFELRKHLPGAGLPLAWLEDPPPFLRRMGEMDSWRRDRVAPREWADRLKTMRSLITLPTFDDESSRDDIRLLQSTAVALAAFDQAIEQVAEFGDELADERQPLADFWKHVEISLAVESLRVPDRRSNVVHVFDVYEARQWELPVVFVCGLNEGHFPQYHSVDSLLSDDERRRAGLPTAVELEDEEKHLFQTALARATEKTILSHARFNDKGDEAAPSVFLDGEAAEFRDVRVHPQPLRVVAATVPAPIQDAALLAKLAKAHRTLAPTSIESFLQCPFQFFAAKTLRLRARPKDPRDRLDMLLQGTILHRALAEVTRAPLLGEAAFDAVFEEACRDARVPMNYRTEAIRLEMRRHFEAFLADTQVTPGWSSRVEEEFTFALNPLLVLRGRIDRVDLGPRDEALVIDYKYSAANKIRERTREDEAENLVQGGLYLLAAERKFGWKPAGMLYCGLRKGVVWDGWHVAIPGLERVGAAVTREVLDEMARSAAMKATQAFETITSGRIAAQPADEKKCAFCDFADICRVETLGAKRAASA